MDNFLGEQNILGFLDELFTMPEEAFKLNSAEIYNVIGTLVIDPNLYRAITFQYYNNHDALIQSIEDLRAKALGASVKYGKIKGEVINDLIGSTLKHIDEVLDAGGFIASVPVKILTAADDVILPEYGHNGDAGMDVRAYIPEEKTITLQPGERKLIPTGIRVIIPGGYEIQLRPRSGLALKQGLSIVNTPGTIDAPYRKDIGVIAINLGQEPITITHQDRIAQMVLKEHIAIEWNKVNEEEFNKFDTNRGEGLGSTGVQ